MRSLPDPKPKQLAYSAAQARARKLITALTTHLDEHAATVAQYSGNLSYGHVAYINKISAMLDDVLCYAKGESEEG